MTLNEQLKSQIQAIIDATYTVRLSTAVDSVLITEGTWAKIAPAGTTQFLVDTDDPVLLAAVGLMESSSPSRYPDLTAFARFVLEHDGHQVDVSHVNA